MTTIRKPKGTTSKRGSEISAPAEPFRSREENLEKRQETAGKPTPADAAGEHEALLEALREANGHLVAANLRSQALAEQMNELYEEAKCAVEAKDEFFAIISHELRTPLTSIIGWAELLNMNPDAATVVEAARSIASSAAVQAHLIDDLLDVSRIMTNKFEIVAAKVDLREVINDGVSAMRPLAAAQHISLRTTAEESVVIDGDAGRLRQVLSNLLANAVKFTPAGGLIRIGLSVADSFAVIEVSDSGEGISAQFLPHVFERRAQAKERRFAGLGLGLAIVKHIIELHHGSVAARSDGEGKGSTFTIRLPCAP